MSENERTPSTLTDHAARLLIGTGLHPRDVAAVAAGTLPAEGGAADALRDGWQAAARQETNR